MGWNGAERVPFLIRDGIDGVRLDVESAAFINNLMERPDADSIVKAAFEACVERVITWFQKNDGETLTDAIRALTPESAILGAQIAELEALAREVEIIRTNWNIDESIRRFDTWIKARKLTYDSQIAALKAKLATPQPKAVDHPNR